MTAKKKRVYRSRTNKVISGIIGGLGEYYDVDPTILRLGWILVALFTGVVPGLIAYFLAILIVPQK